MNSFRYFTAQTPLIRARDAVPATDDTPGQPAVEAREVKTYAIEARNIEDAKQILQQHVPDIDLKTLTWGRLASGAGYDLLKRIPKPLEENRTPHRGEAGVVGGASAQTAEQPDQSESESAQTGKRASRARSQR